MSEKENIREIIVIGRGAESNFVANDGSVSRQHAQIIDYGTYYTVVDLGSTNGTFVNGRRVTSETTLHAGDVLKVGNVVVPWEQLVQPPQKQKKAKVLLAILIPVIAFLLVGGGVTAYLIYRYGQNSTQKAEKEKQEYIEDYTRKINENKDLDNELNQEKNAKKALEQQKKDLDAARKQAEKDKEEANKEAEKARKDAEKARKEAEKAQQDAEKARKEAENTKKESNTKVVEVKKEAEEKAQKKEEDKKAELDKQEAQKNLELKNQYETVKTAINNLSQTKAKYVCSDLKMDLPLTANYINELLKLASNAYNSKDKAKLDEIETAIKRN